VTLKLGDIIVHVILKHSTTMHLMVLENECQQSDQIEKRLAETKINLIYLMNQ
jgi:hypothetical protein